MGFRSGYKFGSVLGSIFGFLFIPAVCYLVVGGLAKFVINSMGAPVLIGDTVGMVVGAGAVLMYIIFKRRGKRTTNNGGAVLSTGVKVTDSIYTLPTSSGGKIKITNPYRGVLVLGGAGAGKSKSVIEPIIIQSIEQGFSGLVYDFKFPTLAQVVQEAVKRNPSNKVKTYYVNFDDLNRSHRVNPLAPVTMPTSSYADEYARTIISNLIPESIKNPNFFSDNAQGYLAAIIWFLREEYPQYCTLPHAMALANQPATDVVNLLSTNYETAGGVASIKEALDRDAGGQTAAIIGTLKNALRKINTREVVWVLSGNDFDLNINNPDDPKFVVLGNNPTLSGAYGPVLALLSTVALKQMNQRDKQSSVAVFDEGPTLFLPGFEQLPATIRSNRVATVFGAQDISQIEDMYGKTKKDSLLSNLNNQFFGRVGHQGTAQYISDLWGKEEVERISRGQSSQTHEAFSSTQSVNYNIVETQRVKIQDILGLRPGEFLAQLVESDYSSLRAQIKPAELGTLPNLDEFTEVTAEQIKDNFMQIQLDIQALLNKTVSPPPAQKNRSSNGKHNNKPGKDIKNDF